MATLGAAPPLSGDGQGAGGAGGAGGPVAGDPALSTLTLPTRPVTPPL